MIHMSKTISFLIVLAFALAACASPTSPPTQVPATPLPATEPTAAAAPVTPAVSANQAAATTPTAQPPDENIAATGAPGSSAAVVYHIVPSSSKVSYQVDEVFLDQGNKLNTAIGVTQGIVGTVTIDQSQPQNSSLGTFTVDVSQFTSDSGRRDNAIRGRFLESSKYPTVTFVPSRITGLPASIEDGTVYNIQVSGDLTIRETTKPVTFDVTVKLTGTTLTGQATAQILMSDFGFGPISLFNMLKTNDEVKVTFDFVANPS
jgi:polyisoprenoid-binding protein YceI